MNFPKRNWSLSDIGRLWVEIGRFRVDIGRFFVDIGLLASLLIVLRRGQSFCAPGGGADSGGGGWCGSGGDGADPGPRTVGRRKVIL